MAAVTRELNELILGGRIDRVHQPSESTLILSIYRHPGKFRLFLSAHAQHARVHLTGQARSNPPVPPLFCLILRKHLEGGRIRSIRQRGLERVLEIGVDTYDELGAPAAKTLYCEVMGKHSNLILVDDGANLIVDGIRRYSHALSRYREVLPGRPYVPPPIQAKLEPGAGEEEFIAACLARPLETPLAALLQQVVNGLSQLTARELVHRAGLSPETALDSCGGFELRSLWETARRLGLDVEAGRYAPGLKIDREGRPCDYAAVALTHCPSSPAGPAMNDVVDGFYQNREDQDFLDKEKTFLRRVVAKAREKTLQKITRAGDDPDRGDTYRLYGELLTANLFRLTKGETAVVLEDYHGGQAREVPLDPSLTPAENAQRYFRLYTRLRGAARTARAVREAAAAEKDYLEGVENALSDAAGRADLEEVRSELARQGYLREGPQSTPRTGGAPQPLELKSADGVAIWIGRNNLQNDHLTMHLAAPNDIWLHARGFPGAHVVIRAAGRPVPDSTLQEAARLAAGFSRGRNDSLVPVDYTRIKYVKKPRGAKPGMVIYEREKTIQAAPKRPGDNP